MSNILQDVLDFMDTNQSWPRATYYFNLKVTAKNSQLIIDFPYVYKDDKAAGISHLTLDEFTDRLNNFWMDEILKLFNSSSIVQLGQISVISSQIINIQPIK